LNRKRAKQSLFLSKQPNRYAEESTDRISLSNTTIIKMVDEKLHQTIEKENTQKIPPMKGILLPWNPRIKDTLWEDNLLSGESYPESHIIGLLGSITFNFGMVVEDHGSSKGVMLDLQPYNKTINTKGTTIVLSNSLDKRYGSLNKATFDRQRQFTSQGFQEIKQLLEN
jgi:hypothetical protein